MALKRPRMHTNSKTWWVFSIFVISDLIKIVCFFLDAIVITVEIGVPAAFLTSCLEVGGGGLGLFMTGFFGEDPIGRQNFLYLWGLAAANAAPFVDDIPFTSPTIFHRIRATEKADRAAEAVYQKKLAEQKEHEDHEQYQKGMQARAVAQKVGQNHVRKQALETSAAAANDNYGSSFAEAA
jgi:hypothetical protein